MLYLRIKRYLTEVGYKSNPYQWLVDSKHNKMLNHNFHLSLDNVPQQLSLMISLNLKLTIRSQLLNLELAFSIIGTHHFSKRKITMMTINNQSMLMILKTNQNL